LNRHRGQHLTFSDNLHQAVLISDVIFIAVGTPTTEQGDADLSYVESVACDISAAIDGNERYKVVVEKSTVPVYTSEWVRKIILRNGADPESFDVASNPEFLREGTAVTDFLFPDRIVIGCETERSADVLREVYAPLTEGSYYKQSGAIPRPDAASIPARIIVTSTKSAELIKHASNAFLALKISFINAVASICEAVGANVNQVCNGLGTDSRIGPRFLNPGIGFGGSCFPKDVLAFRSVARECGYDFRLLDEIMRINQDQRQRFVRKVRSALWTLRDKRLGVLGLAFKGGTDDIRESPAVGVVRSLLQEGCRITAYDPAAAEHTRQSLGPNTNIKFANSAYEAARGADALLILTEWEEFANLDLDRLRQELKYPIVVDGRNSYDPEVMAAHNLIYYSVGRTVSYPTGTPAVILKNGKTPTNYEPTLLSRQRGQ
jgi:UDPglucose 6-dehydrogenase